MKILLSRVEPTGAQAGHVVVLPRILKIVVDDSNDPSTLTITEGLTTALLTMIPDQAICTQKVIDMIDLMALLSRLGFLIENEFK